MQDAIYLGEGLPLPLPAHRRRCGGVRVQLHSVEVVVASIFVFANAICGWVGNQHGWHGFHLLLLVPATRRTLEHGSIANLGASRCN